MKKMLRVLAAAMMLTLTLPGCNRPAGGKADNLLGSPIVPKNMRLTKEKTKSILYIGNSMTFFYGHVGGEIYQIAKDNGYSIEVDSVTYHGYLFSNWLNDNDPMTKELNQKLSEKKFDYVFISSGSKDSFTNPDFKIAGKKVYEKLKKAGVGQVIFWVPHAPRDDSANIEQGFTRATQTKATFKAHEELGKELNTPVSMVALATFACREANPDIEFWHPTDLYHPNENQVVLTALCNFVTITGVDPNTLDITILDEKTAAAIKQAVHDTVYTWMVSGEWPDLFSGGSDNSGESEVESLRNGNIDQNAFNPGEEKESVYLSDKSEMDKYEGEHEMQLFFDHLETRNTATGNLGLTIQVEDRDIYVTELGRIYINGNKQLHNLMIVDAETGLPIPGSQVAVQLSEDMEHNTFIYGKLDSPVKLSAGKKYFIVSSEKAGAGNDIVYECNASIVPRDGVKAIGAAYDLIATPIETDWFMPEGFINRNHGFMVSFKFAYTPDGGKS